MTGLRPITIFHIAEPGPWNGTFPYAPPSLEAEGFVHCSTDGQLVRVADELYAGRTGLTLLVIDARAVAGRLVYEDSYDLGEEFPHIYGPIEAPDVLEIRDFEPSETGRFTLPEGLAPR